MHRCISLHNVLNHTALDKQNERYNMLEYGRFGGFCAAMCGEIRAASRL